MANILDDFKQFQTTQKTTAPQWTPYEKMKAQWFSDDFLKSVWIEAPAKPKSMADIFTSIGGKQQEFTQGAVTWAIRWLGNVGSFLTRNAWSGIDMILPWTPVRDVLAPAAEKFKAWAEKIASSIEWVNKDLNAQSTTSKVGSFVWQTALTSPIGGIAGKATTTAWKIALGAFEGALQWGALDVMARDKLGAWAVLWGVVWGIAPALSTAGKSLYKTAIKPNADEASQIIKATARKTAQPVTRADTAFKYNLLWREKDLWVQGVREADKIFKTTVEPALRKSKAIHNVDDLFSKVQSQIASEKSALRKQELMEWLKVLKSEFKKTGKTKFTTADLQAEKSMLDKFTQSKIFKWKEVAQGYNQVKNTLANVMRNQVREDLAKTGVKNAKELYRDYANLAELEKIGIKWITEWGLRWWTGTALSTIYDALATPVKTIWGKVLYKVGEWLQFTWPKGIRSIKDLAKKAWYKFVWDLLQKD